MKIETWLDNWGGIRMDITGESTHENTLLEMLAKKRICDDYSASERSSTDKPPQTVLMLTFREVEKAVGQSSAPDAVTVGPISTN